MEINQKLNVEAKEFFDALAYSAAYDVSRATGKKVNQDQLYSGCRYKKKLKNKLGQDGEVEVKIRRFESPSCYEAQFRSSQGVNVILYEIEDDKNGSIMVHYKEEFEGASGAKALNYKLVSWFYRRSFKKRASRMLLSMESYIKGQRAKG